MTEYDPWYKYNLLPQEERNRKIREESDRICNENEKHRKEAWGMLASKAFGGDYD